MTTIDPRNTRDIVPVVRAIAERQPYVAVKNLDAADLKADRKGGPSRG